MVIYAILTFIIIGIYFGLSLKVGKRYDVVVESFKNQYPLLFMAPVSLYLIDHFKIMERLYSQIAKIQQKMISLYGNRTALQHTRMYVAQLISTSLVCLLGTFLFTLLSEGDTTILFVGIIFTVMIPYAMVAKLASQEKERKEDILTELPEVVNKVILLVNAGETVQQALIRCVTTTQNPNSPLIRELTETVNKMVSNEPFHQVLNDLSKKCGIQEISIFTTTILLNYRKGGNDLILALRELSHDLWEKRKNISKTKGEEASSKMVFPLIIIFVAVMIIVGYPAITIM
ncbi:Flp pilus assembly protein TadB [Oceanobacillus picturae]|jgi:tight adherence protein C|uniref:Flp pilus assembly protein TadB n=1 Tax=Oceanobacillus picturae TaxID=171693 RepID=W9B501_9BACI|nr:type II secretion system F family protein [Oceanobacillus picturae]RIU93623.1 type II secretion system protein [Oceanobacillus picturae]GAQ19898.1 Flp pilus assembly protein TadB [Oceanobacillus picturae]CDO01795.1 Flp pilus assembly protein TadB [Oceanobacillus picturae]